MASSSLLKTALHNSIADGLYNEFVSRSSRYYYFLGKTLSWSDEVTPPLPVDSVAYENAVRNEFITLKQINVTDIAYVVPRYDWQHNVVYDQYDDQYSMEVQGVNLISGGLGYGLSPTVYIGSTGAKQWFPNSVVSTGDLIQSGDNFYIVPVSGMTGTVSPTHTDGTLINGTASLEHVSMNTGNGTGATAIAYILDGKVIDILLTNKGDGYTSAPTVVITGIGSHALATSVVTIGARTGSQKLESALFYVVTDEFNVYKCIDNNLGALSTIKPFGTTSDTVSLSDGYIWKFLYTIPIALRTKFLTESYIPVITALTNQYYSNGNIDTLIIENPGHGYTYASIVVQGDGFLESDPLYVTNVSFNNHGTGYTTATVIVDPPFLGTSTWSPSALVLLGQRVNYNGNIYEVAISGTTNITGPVHKSGTIQNGNAALTYIGTTASATTTIISGEVSTVTLNQMIRQVNISNGGSGYISAPTVNFTGDGSGAIAVSVLQGGSVTRIDIIDSGENYTTEPTIIFGQQWTASTTYTFGEQIFYANRLYTVTIGGTTSAVAPTHTSGSVINGTATLTYAGVPATGTCSIKCGAGYSSIPSVIISGDGIDAEIYLSGIKSEARLIPIIDGGELIDVQIDDGGVGYSYANLTISGDGTGASISAHLTPGNINSLQANVELLTVSGKIMNIPIVSGGYGYGACAVLIEGDGTGCTATAVIEQGSIVKINVTDQGQNYTWARVTISGSGYGAKARAILSPLGGHGKHAQHELNARSLMFYSNISNDKNQGFAVNNDYRQIGIIKAPAQYNSTYSLTSSLASACWVISGTINPVLYPIDSIITMVDNNARFRIVTNTGSSILAQSLDNGSPIIGTLFINANNNTFNATAVTPPTMDKYSGTLLFIDNKQAFTPTEDQNVTLRTVIKF